MEGGGQFTMAGRRSEGSYSKMRNHIVSSDGFWISLNFVHNYNIVFPLYPAENRSAA